MAYIVGLATKEEIEQIKKMGWEIEDAPAELIDSETDPDLADAEGYVNGVKYIMVWSGASIFDILNGEPVDV